MNNQKKEFAINIVSTQETENLMAEIYFGEYNLCTVHNESGMFEVQIFYDNRINPGLESLSVNLVDFISILEKAKNELMR